MWNMNRNSSKKLQIDSSIILLCYKVRKTRDKQRTCQPNKMKQYLWTSTQTKMRKTHKIAMTIPKASKKSCRNRSWWQNKMEILIKRTKIPTKSKMKCKYNKIRVTLASGVKNLKNNSQIYLINWHQKNNVI